MTILVLHGWQRIPGGDQTAFLSEHGHTVVNPTLDNDDFDAAVRTAQRAFDQHRPSVVVGSSRGGAVAMHIDIGNAQLVLLCPAWKRWGRMRTVKPSTIILHSRDDEVIPWDHSRELANASGATLITVGHDHCLATPEPLAAMLEACESNAPKVLGCDFGAPRKAGDQARKIIAIEAISIGEGHYAIRAYGRNLRLTRWNRQGVAWPENRPGWTIPALRDSLAADASLRVGTFDFPFSLPVSLLESPEFAQRVGSVAPFRTRANWRAWVANHLRLQFHREGPGGEMEDLARFDAWRDPTLWHARACDIATRACPPLKHIGQNLFSMTLAGAALLESLKSSGYRIQVEDPPDSNHRVLMETYPSLIARRIGFRGSYKREPVACLDASLEFLQRRGIRLDVAPAVRAFCETYRTGTGNSDPDGADAMLCLVSALCFREGLAEIHYGDADARRRVQEGGIVAPR